MIVVPIDGAYLIGSFAGLVCYGIYAAFFCATMYQLHERARDSKIVSSILIVLFSFTSAYYVLTLVDCYRAFVSLRLNPGPIAYLDHGYINIIAPIKDAFAFMALFVADLLIVWRISVIWPTNRIVLVVAAVLMTSMLACWTTTVVLLFEGALRGDSSNVEKTYKLTAAAAGLVIVNNVMLTSSIAGRLFWMGRQVAAMGYEAQGVYKRISYTLIQSGTGYLLVAVIECALHAIGNRSAVFVSIQVAPALVGTFPTAIVFQLNLQSQAQSTRHHKRAHSDGKPLPIEVANSGNWSAGAGTVTNIRFAAESNLSDFESQATDISWRRNPAPKNLETGIGSALEARPGPKAPATIAVGDEDRISSPQ